MVSLKKSKSELLQPLIAFAIGIGLVIVDLIRIINIPITIDETGYHKIDTYSDLIHEKLGHANNHILHSLFRKFFAETFTDTPFFLRLDSLLALIVYLFFSYLIGKLLFKNRWWQLGSFIVLNLNSPFLFNFWGLSRGYGLGIAFTLLSVYYLLKYLENRTIKFLCYSLAGSVLAVYSNYSLLNYFVTLIGIVFIIGILFKNQENNNRSLLKSMSAVFIAIIVLAIMITGPLTRVYHFGELTFMGNKGFIEDTVKSLLTCGFFLRSPDHDKIIKYTIIVLISTTLLSQTYWLIILVKDKIKSKITSLEDQQGIILSLLVILPCISVILQHNLLNINYVTDRAALFLIPVFLLSFTHNLWQFRKINRFLSGILAMVFVTFMSYTFLSKLNLDTTYLWWFERDDYKVLERVTADSPDKTRKIRFSMDRFSVQAMMYDVDKFYTGRFDEIGCFNDEVAGKDTSYDYYYINIASNNDTIKKYYYLLEQFEADNFLLYARKKPGSASGTK